MTNLLANVRAWAASKYFNFLALLKKVRTWSVEYFDRAYFLDSKALWWAVAILLGYQLSKKWLWEKFDVLAVDGFLKGLRFEPLGKWWLLIYLILLAIPAIFCIKRLIRNSYKLTIINLFLLWFLLVLYWLHRKNYAQFDLYQASINNWLLIHLKKIGFSASALQKGPMGFFDPIAAVGSTFAIVLLINVFRVGIFRKGSTLLSQDIPIKNIADDKFDRTSYFDPLISELRQVAFDSTKAFAVGINSTWGYGKTSLLEIMKKVFDEEEKYTVFMEYNPWMSAVKSGLTLDFFAQLQNTLSAHIETDNLIIKYGKALSKIDLDKNPLKVVSGFFESDLSLFERHEQVSKLLLKTNKRFVVVIDDIDRLDNSEVFEVLRLIRNTANFGRIMFVAAYDKNYLTGALGQNHIHDPKKYLEKIFDIELSLPKIGISRLQAMIMEAFTTGIGNFVLVAADKLSIEGQFKDLIYATISSSDRKLNAVGAHIWSVLKNKRDIVRFINAVLLTYKVNQKWVYLPDLVILELIKLIDHNVYLELSSAQGYLENSNATPPVYKLFIGSPSAGPPVARMLGLATMRHDVRTDKGEAMTALINALFENSSASHYQSDKALKIVENFENYFIYANKSVTSANIANIIRI